MCITKFSRHCDSGQTLITTEFGGRESSDVLGCDPAYYLCCCAGGQGQKYLVIPFNCFALIRRSSRNWSRSSIRERQDTYNHRQTMAKDSVAKLPVLVEARMTREGELDAITDNC